MKRREFISGLRIAVACSVAAIAQQSDRVRRVGVLMHVTEHDADRRRHWSPRADEVIE